MPRVEIHRKAVLSKENVEKIFSPKQIVIWDYLKRGKEVAPGKISKDTKIVRLSIAQVLDKLLKLKKIELIGVVADNLVSKVVKKLEHVSVRGDDLVFSIVKNNSSAYLFNYFPHGKV